MKVGSWEAANACRASKRDTQNAASNIKPASNVLGVLPKYRIDPHLSEVVQRQSETMRVARIEFVLEQMRALNFLRHVKTVLKQAKREWTHMPAMKSESWHFDTLGEMLAIAASMEKEAIDGYLDLSARMSAFGRPDLAEVFNALVAEETDHLDKVREWSAVSGTEDTLTETTAEKLFDDEGAGIVAPELLSAYRAFSMAVRNEERAFMFWTYVSAHAQSREIRHAAERMAREELGHVAKLRSERRRAFHLERAKVSHARPDLRVLEDRLSRRLEATAANAKSGEREIVQEQCLASRSRMTSMEERGFQVDLPSMSD
ncbi:ferritin family protein (plasmid) [Rhizobium sp. 32-5/1]|uniref:ferritin-like domain-containing protein n=1 Tax=Rhizobium sp. 32-5/1 TaxID=3019602 RepID=UPI00240E1581|nr:ferritin family protein [Rhizobium sp. 32-5/1]WEZ85736.1 ferritin family protein [Rhizobium sp. 32-5/1]